MSSDKDEVDFHIFPQINTTMNTTIHNNIAYFCGSIEHNKDGVTRVLSEIHRFNARNHVTSVFITPVTGETPEMPFIQVKGIPIPKYNGYKLSISPWISIRRKIRRSQFTPSLFHLHSPCTLGLAGWRLARSWKIPVVATYHTHFPSYFQYHGAAKLEQPVRNYSRYFYNLCDATIVPSKTLYQELQKDGLHNLWYLPHGVDIQQFHTQFRSDDWRQRMSKGQPEKTILLYVGRLVWEKNLRLLALVAKELYAHRDDIEVVIVGTGPAEKELQTLLPQAKFLGFQTGRTLSEIYASADIFVFPSDTETFGNVTLEAMASGLVPVVANAGGSSDLVLNGDNGIALSPHDHTGWYQTLIHLIEQKESRKTMAFRAFHHAQFYTWESILQDMHGIYSKITDEYIRQSPHTTRKKSLLYQDYPGIRQHQLQTVISSLYQKQQR